MINRIKSMTLTERLLIGFILTAVVSVALILTVDRDIAIYFNSVNNPALMYFSRLVSMLGTGWLWISVCIFIIAAGFIGKKIEGKNIWSVFERYQRPARWGLASLILSGAIVLAMKIAIGRLRPRYLFSPEAIYGFAPFTFQIGKVCFPSGHAETAFVVATILKHCYPRLGWMWYLVAVLVALSRIILTAHFAADVVMGAYVGFAATLLLRKKNVGLMPVIVVPGRGKVSTY